MNPKRPIRPRSAPPQPQPPMPKHWWYNHPYYNHCYDYDYDYDYDYYRPYSGHEYAAPPKPKASNIDGIDNGWYNYSSDDIQAAYQQGFQDGWAACWVHCMPDATSNSEYMTPSKPLPKVEEIE